MLKTMSTNAANTVLVWFAILTLASCGGGGGTGVAAPSALSYTSPTQATADTALTPLSPTVTGTVTNYSVTPALPAGLSLNMTSGVISGTPTASAAQATYTITAKNGDGSTTFGWVLTVSAGPTMIGPSGGSVTDVRGDQLQIPPDTFIASIPVTLDPLRQQDLQTLLGRDVTQEQLSFLGGVSINTGGTAFQQPATLSFANSGNISSSQTPVLMRVLPNFNGNATLVLTDAGTVEGTKIVTGTAGFPGVLQDGQYVLLLPAQPLQFISGTVVDQSGNPVDQAIVVPLPGGQFVAQTDPGAFIAAVPLPAQKSAQVPISVATLFPANSPAQYSLSTGVLAPSPGTIVPISPIKFANAPLSQIANQDLSDKCPVPDEFLEEHFKDLLIDFAATLSGVAQGETIPVSPKSISLSPSSPAAELTLDFGAFFQKLIGNAAPGGTILNTSQLAPFYFKCQLTAQELASGAGSSILPAAMSGNPSIVIVGVPDPINNGLQATFTVSLPPSSYTLDVVTAGTGTGTVAESGQHDGQTTIQGCVSHVSYNIENNYSLTCPDATDTCSNGQDPSQVIDIKPGSASPICLETTIPVTVTGTTSAGPPYNDGTTVTLTASPGAGSVFTGWSGACSGTGACVLAMNSDQTVVATFSLSTNSSSSSGGSTSSSSSSSGSSSGGGSTSSSSSSSSSSGGSSSSSGSSGSSGGSGATLTVNVSGDGSVTDNLNSDSCVYQCVGTLPIGTTIVLTAIPTPLTGSTFIAWSGACTGIGSCTITMTANMVVTATFQDLGLIGTWCLPGSGVLTGSCYEMIIINADGTYSDTTYDGPLNSGTSACTLSGTWNAFAGFLALTDTAASAGCGSNPTLGVEWSALYTVSGDTLFYDYNSGYTNYTKQ